MRMLLRWGMTRMRSDLLAASRGWCRTLLLCGVRVAVASMVLVVEYVSCTDERWSGDGDGDGDVSPGRSQRRERLRNPLRSSIPIPPAAPALQQHTTQQT